LSDRRLALISNSRTAKRNKQKQTNKNSKGSKKIYFSFLFSAVWTKTGFSM
jgi:hypothetical protein